MENILRLKRTFWNKKKLDSSFFSLEKEREQVEQTKTLAKAKINSEYIIQSIKTESDEVQDFLFTLGCYSGEKITLISVLADQFVIVVKDARYSIDIDLAECIGI